MSSSSDDTSASPTSLPTQWSDVVQPNSHHLSSSSSLLPPLTSTTHKGSHGRIAIFGGSEKYTGAPYYSAASALNIGADLVSVFCAEEAAVAIKCYSPELMVQSVYSVEELEKSGDADACNKGENEDMSTKVKKERILQRTVEKVTSTFPSLHALCIGPGMGRHERLFPAIASIIDEAIECNLSLVLDADALYMLSLEEYGDLLMRLLRYDKVVMTPNLMEYKRLKEAVGKRGEVGAEERIHCPSGIIVQKGNTDVITQQSMTLECKERGGLKRSGGIGDVLAGAISAFMAWNTILQRSDDGDDQNTDSTQQSQNRILAAWTACCVVKKATRKAFEKKQRSMSAQHVLEELGGVIAEMEQDLASCDH